MKFLKSLWDAIWRLSVTLVIITSGVYLLGKIMEILIEQKSSDLTICIVIVMYSIVIVGMVYKLNIHDAVKSWWEKRKGKNMEK